MSRVRHSVEEAVIAASAKLVSSIEDGHAEEAWRLAQTLQGTTQAYGNVVEAEAVEAARPEEDDD